MKKRTGCHGHSPFLMILVLLAGSLWLMSCSESSDGDSSDKELCATVDCNGGSCYVENGEARCQCPEGFISGDQTCLPNPCSPDPCVYGVCTVSGSQPVCQCDEGYAGDLCDLCASGYMPRDGACVQGDPCESDPCVFGLCSMQNGEINCTCNTGYAGEICDRCADGYHAESLRCISDDGPCSPNPCVHGQCSENGADFSCSCFDGYAGSLCEGCDEGYVLSGLSCVPEGSVNPCDPNPCLDDSASCVETGSGGYVCECPDGLVYNAESGECEEYTDPCDPNPCQGVNRTRCEGHTDGSHECFCDAGYRENDSGECVEDTSSVPVRDCGVLVQYQSGTSGPVYLRGEFNSWGTSHPLTKNGNVWEITISNLAVGDYGYKLYDESNDSWFLDPNNPFTKYVNGEANSRLHIRDCTPPMLELSGPPTVGADSIRFGVAAYRGRNGADLDESSIRVLRNGEATSASFNADDGTFTVEESGLDEGKYSYLFQISDVEGKRSESLFVPIWVEAEAFGWEDAILYFVLTDRFKNGNTSNDGETLSASDPNLDWKADWQGGDFAGIKEKVEDGYFQDLGINTLWISSPVMNTQGAFWGSDGHKYTGYHSYWPISTGWTEDNELPGVQVTDPHFGSLEDFQDLVQTAHEHGMRVLIDFVANHVHTDSPLYEEHWQDSTPWFNWDNGTAGQGYVCGWERPIECWFAEYLPDFDYRNLDAMETVMDHAIWLVKATNVDGFRMDAVKHMILEFTSTLRGHLDEEIDTTGQTRFYMVGETFTGEDERDTIKLYVGEDLLDGQFDFPFFWKSLKALMRHEMSLSDLKNFMNANDGFYGQNAVMSTFLGNHDVPRLIGHADGTIPGMYDGMKELAWTNPPSATTDEWPYKKLRQAMTFMFSQVGIPLIYYGDEYGMPGAGDPDNRRMMEFSGLNSQQQATLTAVQKLGQWRQRHTALRRGSRQTLVDEENYWAFVMKDGDDKVLVVLNRGGESTQSLNVGQAGMADGSYTDPITGQNYTVSGGQVSITAGAVESVILEQAN